jgi:hypothetical protein
VLETVLGTVLGRHELSLLPRVPQKRKWRRLAPPPNQGTSRSGGANATRFARVPQQKRPAEPDILIQSLIRGINSARKSM